MNSIIVQTDDGQAVTLGENYTVQFTGDFDASVQPSVVTLADLKAHLNVTTATDDALLTSKLAAAESYVAAFTGDLATAFPSGLPEALKEAVRQLAAHFYENREAVVSDERRVVVLPYGVEALIAPFRQWVF